MEVIYSILETILPFEFMEYAFMKNAFIAILLISPIFAILGTMIVNNKMAFFSDALGHSALTGIAIGMILRLFKHKLFNDTFCHYICITAKLRKKQNKLWSRYNN
jgi:zinc transport system permease protein